MTIPILVRLGYDKSFATAIVAVAGGLGVIIPPSIPFIMYGMASGESVSGPVYGRSCTGLTDRSFINGLCHLLL